MKTKMKKALLLLCCALLLVGVSVGATIAYLTSTTTEVENTFTVGNVIIDLDEAAVKYDAETNKYTAEDTRVQENTYNILPGTVVDKDPTITVYKDSENCYVRAIVTVTYPDAANTFDVSWLGDTGSGWTRTDGTPELGADGNYTLELEYRYDTVVDKNSEGATKLPPIFTTLTIPTDLNNADIAKLASFKIDVVGHAIQSGGFADAAAAWAAFDAQN